MRTTRRLCSELDAMLVTASLLLVVSGCATGPDAAQINDADVSHWIATLPEPGADYGAYPSDYQKIIETAMAGMLKDPESARYDGFSQPKHDQVVHLEYAPDGAVGVTKTAIYGYSVCASVNAKNSFGGYTGDQEYWFLIRNGRVVRSTQEGGILYMGHFATC